MSTVAPVVYELWVIEVTYMIFDFLKKIKARFSEFLANMGHCFLSLEDGFFGD